MRSLAATGARNQQAACRRALRLFLRIEEASFRGRIIGRRARPETRPRKPGQRPQRKTFLVNSRPGEPEWPAEVANAEWPARADRSGL